MKVTPKRKPTPVKKKKAVSKAKSKKRVKIEPVDEVPIISISHSTINNGMWNRDVCDTVEDIADAICENAKANYENAKALGILAEAVRGSMGTPFIRILPDGSIEANEGVKRGS